MFHANSHLYNDYQIILIINIILIIGNDNNVLWY